MMFDHLLFDLAEVFFVPIPFISGYLDWEVRTVIRIGVVLSFVLLCGISCSFSRSNFSRGFKLAAVAITLSLATKLVDLIQGQGDRFVIVFGVLHMLAASILVYAVLERYMSRKKVLLLGSILAGIGVYFYIALYSAPPGLEALSIIVPLKYGIYSADLFPILPGLGFLLIGGFLGPILYCEKKSRFPLKGEPRLSRPFLFLGRHALIIYLVHQPLLLGVLSFGFLLIRGL